MVDLSSSLCGCLPEGSLREFMGNWIKLLLCSNQGDAQDFSVNFACTEGEAILDLVHMPGIRAIICSS